MTYFPESQRYRALFSMSMCNIDVFGCCDTGLPGRSYQSCYTVNFRINSEDNCENQIFQARDAGLGARYITVTTCERYEYCKDYGELNPFNVTGINVNKDSNAWKLMNEAIRIQSGIPAQSGIYQDGSYVGVYVSPVGPQQLP